MGKEKYMKDFNGEKIFSLEYDKETLKDMVLEKQEEIERLNNIINELENYIKVELKDVIPMWNLKTHYSFGESTIYEYILNKLQELKGSEKGVISELTAITPEYMKHRIEEETQQYQQEIERLNKLISQREKKWEKWTTEKTILSTKMSDYLCKYQNIKREYTKQIKISTDRKKEVKRLNNIIKEALEKSKGLQYRFGYVLDDLVYLLMRESDKE